RLSTDVTTSNYKIQSLTKLLNMKKITLAAILFSALTMNAFAQDAKMTSEKTVTVGGAPMYPSKNIVENAVNSKDHTTLVAAVSAAGLVETLKTAGPFTVFAPTNAAFEKLPAGTVETLLKPENKSTLTAVLTYHVVSGKLNAKDIQKAIKKGNGTAELTTVQGGKLWAMEKDGKIWIKDEKGGTSMVTIADVNQSNGVIHVVDTVVLPKS
ncbi:MAG TPA: fasciclin domain-containing protein, partial [Flavisolibacter sp.]